MPLPSATSRSVGEILRANIVTRFNFILGVLLAVILAAGEPQDAVFGIILVANAAIGIGQELRAKRTLDRLAVLTAPTVRVVRDGTPSDVRVADLVPGDLVQLRPGDQLVADGVVRTGMGLQADESLLTGESEPVRQAAGRRAAVRQLCGGRIRRLPGHGRGRRVVRPQARRRSEAVHPGAVGADGRHQPDPAVRDLGDRAGRRPAAGQPAARRRHLAGDADRDGRGAGGHGAAGPGAADQRRFRRGGRRPDAAAGCWYSSCPLSRAWPGSMWCASTRPGLSPTERSHSTGLSASTTQAPVEAALGALGADENRNATLTAIGQAFPAPSNGWVPEAAVPFSSARKWSAVSLRRARRVGARSTGDDAAGRTTARCWRRRRSWPRPDCGSCYWAARTAWMAASRCRRAFARLPSSC